MSDSAVSVSGVTPVWVGCWAGFLVKKTGLTPDLNLTDIGINKDHDSYVPDVSLWKIELEFKGSGAKGIV